MEKAIAGAPRRVSAEVRRSSDGNFCANQGKTDIGMYPLSRCRRHTYSTSSWLLIGKCGGGLVVAHVGVGLAVGQYLSQSPRPLARRHLASSCPSALVAWLRLGVGTKRLRSGLNYSRQPKAKGTTRRNNKTTLSSKVYFRDAAFCCMP